MPTSHQTSLSEVSSSDVGRQAFGQALLKSRWQGRVPKIWIPSSLSQVAHEYMGDSASRVFGLSFQGVYHESHDTRGPRLLEAPS